MEHISIPHAPCKAKIFIPCQEPENAASLARVPFLSLLAYSLREEILAVVSLILTHSDIYTPVVQAH